VHGGHRNEARRVLIPALVALSVLIAAGVAQAVTRDINDSGLFGAGRAWDFTNDAGVFSPVDDGVLFAGRLGPDAFDGGLIVRVNGTDFVDGDGEGDFNTTTNAFAVGPDPTGALTVARTEVAKGPYLRSLIRLRNPSASPFTGTITWYSNVGADGAEVTQASSSGDQSFTAADRWVVSSEPGANGFGDDPTVSFVLYGTGARERVDTVINGPGDGEITVDFENLTIPGNGTRYLLFYTEMSASPQVATNAATKYNPRRLSPALLEGISRAARNQTLNWDL
jgi:hypothetical protein